ncbi:unnamed protein product [Rotaria sp. Silwood2]|nr:unnamed protein product [Rotaria sp. Silwood2]CAF2693937.1 unnamed protein product [Rotaria sp. Silwood2]CAF3088678.1 unnamed protein product [Rotaria sp. Silwood2]CAF4269887.1 unnamed protein product [Rotaria sp. Silwood2]CAF4300177.1 unnamed protein product [Rotaria sp. Silwood2]
MLRESRIIEGRILKVLVTHHPSLKSNNDGNNLDSSNRKQKETISSILSMNCCVGLAHWQQTQRSLHLRCENDDCSIQANLFCSKS